jgi:hypothetical protein
MDGNLSYLVFHNDHGVILVSVDGKVWVKHENFKRNFKTIVFGII